MMKAIRRLVKYPTRLKRYFANGCSYWKAEMNKPNCSFPNCWCYPEWSEKKRRK